jgi:hypothetical protein
MTPEPKKYTSEFTNRHGEAWHFEYNYDTREGLLRGSDVDWKSYGVRNGHAKDLILSKEEIQWLRSAWLEATTATKPT